MLERSTLAGHSRNENSEYLPQRRKGRKEIKLPDLAFLASWREQISAFDSHDLVENFAQAAKTSQKDVGATGWSPSFTIAWRFYDYRCRRPYANSSRSF